MGSTTPSGVVATDDIDALVALDADCVVYTSQAETRPGDAIDEICRFLAAGTNVVGTSMVWLVAPEHADDWLRDPLEQACKTGGTSLYINGIDPGFSGDTLVYTALSLLGTRHRDHRAGDLRLRQLRRRRIHRRQLGFRHHARPHADHVPARCAGIHVGRTGAKASLTASASSSTTFVNGTKPG